MRTLFMGMPGPFGSIVLERLLANDIRIAAVLLNGQKSVPLRTLFSPGASALSQPEEGLELPLLNASAASSVAVGAGQASDVPRSTIDFSRPGGESPKNLPALAFQKGVPTYECGEIGHPEVTEWFAEKALDVVCVACWNRIIPISVLGIPRHGFLNVHPSMLPAYRGPFPLFWQYKEGESETGVSVHWMDADLDSGDLAGQREIQFEDGIPGTEAEALCASSGGDLLAEVLAELKKGESLRRPQPAGGSYFPAPTNEDFALDADWHPRRAFNFMRANAEWGVPFRFESEGSVRWLADALEWREGEAQEPTGEGRVWVSFRGGMVLAVECPGPPFDR